MTILNTELLHARVIALCGSVALTLSEVSEGKKGIPEHLIILVRPLTKPILCS